MDLVSFPRPFPSTVVLGGAVEGDGVGAVVRGLHETQIHHRAHLVQGGWGAGVGEGRGEVRGRMDGREGV